MKVLLIGLGSIGKRYASLLTEMYPEYELFALRSGTSSADSPQGVTQLTSWKQVRQIAPEAAFITNPTHLHVDTACECAREGMHMLIEKPISAGMSGITELLSLIKARGLTAYVAYCLRFHPVIIELKRMLDGRKILHASVTSASYLPDWRPGTDHLESYSAFKDRGGGAILDLSHEFDYIHYVLGPFDSIQGMAGAGHTTFDADAWADALISHKKGHITSLHLSLESVAPRRRIEVDTEGAFYEADLINPSIRVTEGGSGLLKEFSFERNDMFRSQIKYFFDNIGNPGIMNGINEAVKLFEQIVGFRERVLA